MASKAGLVLNNYVKITGTSAATATRDLVDLVKKEALRRVGEHKYARYYLNMPKRIIKTVTINDQGKLVNKKYFYLPDVILLDVTLLEVISA